MGSKPLEPMSGLNFTPSPDVQVLLNALLDRWERRLPVLPVEAERGRRAVRCRLSDLELPGYFSQIDPAPRQVANGQLQSLAEAGWLRLTWLTGETGNLLGGILLEPGHIQEIFRFIGRAPLAGQRARLEALLLGERFRFARTPEDWRSRAVQTVLVQLKKEKSPAPFLLADPLFNQDLLTALSALDDLNEETPYRVFSVRIFNDSKRFELLVRALVRLARLGQPEWRRLPAEEVLRELNLVANPGYLYLSGAWELAGADGEILSLQGFTPSVGISVVQAAHLQRVQVQAPAVICIENLTTYYEAIRHMHASTQGARLLTPAFLCLSGNPSPACRSLLRCLSGWLPSSIPLFAWADLDYGGLNILRQLRRINPNFKPYRMDVETLENHRQYARPLTAGDIRSLKRLAQSPDLADLRPVIAYMLHKGIKLEQEAIAFSSTSPY